MSVNFDKIVIKNNTGLNVTVTVEAPVGTPLKSAQMGEHREITIEVGKKDCPSVLLYATDVVGSPHAAKQVFAMTPPGPDEGRGAFLEVVEMEYNAGDLKGKIQARTE